MLFSKAREPVNSLTHFIGAVASAAFTLLLADAAAGSPEVSMKGVAGAVVFGLSMVALYASSALYHYVNCPPETLARLRKLDHAMIFVLIAGTYTPLLLHFSPARGVALTCAIWGAALAGIVMKVFWMGAPRWLSTLLYVALGWAIVLDPAILRVMPGGCIALLLAGGISYTAGALIYWLKKPNWFKKIGFHELFHLFVLLGSLFHFLAIYFYAV